MPELYYREQVLDIEREPEIQERPRIANPGIVVFEGLRRLVKERSLNGNGDVNDNPQVAPSPLENPEPYEDWGFGD